MNNEWLQSAHVATFGDAAWIARFSAIAAGFLGTFERLIPHA
jgi:hypothetical protein